MSHIQPVFRHRCRLDRGIRQGIGPRHAFEVLETGQHPYRAVVLVIYDFAGDDRGVEMVKMGVVGQDGASSSLLRIWHSCSLSGRHPGAPVARRVQSNGPAPSQQRATFSA